MTASADTLAPGRSEPREELRTGSRRTLALSAAGAIIGLLLAGYTLFTTKDTNGGGIPPEDVALVNGRPILQSDFVTQTQLETGSPFPDTTAAERRKTLAAMIDEELLVQRGLEVDLAASDPDVRSALVAGVNLQVDAEVLAAPPDEAALRRYYDAHRERYAQAGTMKLRDFTALLSARPAAEAAVAAIRAGGSADEAAKNFSLKESGRLGQDENFDFGVKAKLGEKLYAAAATLADGGVADPVEDAGVLHVIYMAKRKLNVPLAFEAARDNVWQDYQRAARAAVERANLEFLKGRAVIKVAPGLLP